MSIVLKQDLTLTILFQSDPKPVCLTNTEISTSTFKLNKRHEKHKRDSFIIKGILKIN